MDQGLIATILAFIVYISTSVFGVGGGETVRPETPPPAPPQQTQPGRAVVSTDEANLRSEPSLNSPVIATLSAGNSLTIRQEQDQWYQVTEENGRTGWMVKWALESSQHQLSPGTGREIIGYYAESYRGDLRGLQSFRENMATITTVAPFSYRIDRDGNIHGQINAELLKTAQTNERKTLAVVTNIQGTNFNRELIGNMLRSKTARKNTVNNLLNLLRKNNYAGVNIDFENVPAQDRSYLTAFFRELATALRPHNYLVTAALPAKTAGDRSSSWSGAFDYSALAPYLDWAVIMTYDQHQANSSPGPIASQEWVESVIQYSLEHFSPGRLLMGVAAYGYAWNDRSGRALNYAAIENLIQRHRVAPQWHDRYQTPFFTYTDSGVRYEVWYENQRSTAAKMRLVDKYNLRGAAVWRLGYEDPGIWEVMK